MVLIIFLLGKLRILKSIHFYYICHTSMVLISVTGWVNPRRINSIKHPNYLTGNQTHNLPACSTMETVSVPDTNQIGKHFSWIMLGLLTTNYMGSIVSLRSWKVLSWSRNFLHFMEPEGSSSHSHKSLTCPYSEPDQSCPCSPIALPDDPF
jgi:hypothetical protein